MNKNKLVAILCAAFLFVGTMTACQAPWDQQEASSLPAAVSAVPTATPAPTEEPVASTKTQFFDFAMGKAQLVDEYGGKTPTQGGKFLKLEITVTNITSTVVPMYDTDFQLVTSNNTVILPQETFNDEMVPMEYELKEGESATYTYLYDVPAEETEFKVLYQEEYDDPATGESRVQGETYQVPVELS
ncbi:MAG: hypothetical protein PWQ08_644 [Clostridiales bacterium]|jgi:hypothetical protein|nr:hypothetical protein [Clostridiales bacterium]